MSLFNFNQNEILTFFAVLVRYSVLVAVLPFVGDNGIPAPVKVLLSLAFSIALFPALLANGHVHTADAAVWGATAGGIITTIIGEVVFALVMGYTAKLAFEAISFGGNLVGNFMGYGMASMYDPHQESQSQVAAQLQMAVAMLLFLALDGHHLMLKAALQSYSIVGVGGAFAGGKSSLSGAFSAKIIELSGQVIRYGIQLSAPVAISLFGVNLVFGMLAKAMPQLNVLVLSVSVSAVLGLLVFMLSMPEFMAALETIYGRMGESMESVIRAMAKG